jgi:hypothetical protein
MCKIKFIENFFKVCRFIFILVVLLNCTSRNFLLIFILQQLKLKNTCVKFCCKLIYLLALLVF